MLYLISFTILPYIVFIYFSEGLNPIAKPRNLAKRSRWRYGHAMSIASITGGVSSVAMMQTMEHTAAQSFSVGITIATLLGLVFSTSKITGFFQRQ